MMPGKVEGKRKWEWSTAKCMYLIAVAMGAPLEDLKDQVFDRLSWRKHFYE